MTAPQALITALLAGLTLAAVLSTLRSSISPWRKRVLIAVRALSGLLLILAFLEPVFTIHGLPERGIPVPVLLDVSRSMSLFSADSAVRTFREKVVSRRGAGDFSGPPFCWFSFGDSLREVSDTALPAFDDRTTVFPQVSGHPGFPESTPLIVISDGNWSNPSRAISACAPRVVWYLPLRKARDIPRIHLEAPDTVTGLSGKPSEIRLHCSGYAASDDTLVVTVTEGGRGVAADTFSVKAGSFSLARTMALPPSTPGIRLHDIKLATSGDTLTLSRRFLRHSVAERFVYAVRCSTRASLDLRFFRLALAGDPAFTDKKGAESPDVIFMFDTMKTRVPSGVLQVYIGCLPGKTAAIDSLHSGRPFIPVTGETNPLSELPLDELPPLSSVMTSGSVFPFRSWLSLRLRGDTVPLVFSGVYRDRPLVACAFSECWRWDFLPLSHAAGEADAFGFTRKFCSLVASTLRSRRTDTLIVFSPGPQSAGSQVRLSCVAPAHDNPFSPLRLRCSLEEKNGGPWKDTTVELYREGGLLQILTLPPLEEGTYTVRCSIATGRRQYSTIADFTVAHDMGELSISGQNEALLNEIGHALDIGDPNSVSALLRAMEMTGTVPERTKSVALRKTWLLLIILLLLFGVEWVVRRYAGLE